MNWRWKKQNKRIQHHNRNGKGQNRMFLPFFVYQLYQETQHKLFWLILKRFVWKVNSFIHFYPEIAVVWLKQPQTADTKFSIIFARTGANRK